MARTRSFSRARLLTAGVALAMPLALLAALPSAPAASAPPAVAAGPGDFKDSAENAMRVVDLPPKPATFVSTGDKASYHALTEAGTAVMEFGKRGSSAVSEKVLKMWADDEPFRKVGGAPSKIADAVRMVAGDVDGDGLKTPPTPGSGDEPPTSVEMAWLTPTSLVVSGPQKEGFPLGDEIALPTRPSPPVGLMILEAHLGGDVTAPIVPGEIVVAYPDRTDTYRMTGGQLALAQSDPMIGGKQLAVYHKPVHEALALDEAPGPHEYMSVTEDNNRNLWLHEIGGPTPESRPLGLYQGTPWTDVSLAYDLDSADRDGNFRKDLQSIVVARGANGKNTVWVDDGSALGGQPPVPLPEAQCQGTGPVAVDLEAMGRGGGGMSWACSVVSTGTGGGGADELVQWHDGTVSRETVDGQAKVVAPQPQITLPCLYLLENEPFNSMKECSAGTKGNLALDLGTPTLTTYVSAGDTGALGSYLVTHGAPKAGQTANFTVRAATGTAARPSISVPLPVQRTQMKVKVLNDGNPQIVQSAPVPVAFLAAPPQVAGSGQDADPPEFGTTSGTGGSSGTSTATSFGVSLGIEYEDPLGAFGAGIEAEVERSVETGVETSHDVETSEEFRGLLENDVVVYNALRIKRYQAEVVDSTTGVGYQPQPIELDLPLDGVTSAASVGYLKREFPEFQPSGIYGPVLEQVFDHEVGDPGSYRSWGSDGASVENYCDGALGAQGDRDLDLPDPRVPNNPFVSLSPDEPAMPDILHSDVHQVLAGTGNSEGATFSITDSTTTSRIETWDLEITASARVAYVNASVSAGFAWSKNWTNTVSDGVGFASFVGHIPGEDPILKSEQYDWRSFLCQKTVTPAGGGLPVKGWVLNYAVDNYQGSGGLEELADLELISPKGSVEVAAPRPDLTFEQETGTVKTYDWELQAVNVNDVHGGAISFANPKESNAQRQVSNTVKPGRDLLPGQLYRWRVKSTDFFDNRVTSDWEFFRTPSPASAPQAVITVSPTTVNAGETVSFENDTVPGAMAPIYTWNFGDGTTVTTSDAVVPHVFAMAGTYVVTLTAVTAAGTTTDTVEIRVLPRLAADTYRTDEDTALNATNGVLANDAGVSTAVLVQGTNNGALDLKPDGTFTYTPKADFCGADAFTYSAGAVNQVATITVACVNDAPKAVDDAYSLREDGQQTVDLAANDNDVDGDTLTLTAGSPAHGTVTKEPDGRFTYKPAANWCGTDEFAVTVSDGKGGSSTAKARAHVECVNDLPVAGDDTYRMDEDTQQTVNLLANDTDVDGDALLITSGSARNGTVTPGANGAVTYKPERDWCGTDEFVSTVTDGKGGIDTSVARVTVVCINDGPVGSDDEVTLDEDGTITVNPVGNDPDGDTLTVTVSDPDHGTVTEDDRGHLVYHPDPDYCGPDSFTVTLSDGKGGTSTMTVRVTVECSNDAPTGVDDSVSTKEDKRLTLDPTKNDTDPDGAGGALTVQLGADPDHGDVRLLLSGKVSYVPRADFCGTDRFTYRPVDDEGAAGVRATTVTIDVQCVNDRPKAARDEFSRRLPKSGKRIVKVPVPGVLRNDTDVDSKLKAVLVRGSDQGKVRLRANGSFTIRVPNGKDAPRWIAFTYRACDDQQCSRNRRAVVQLR